MDYRALIPGGPQKNGTADHKLSEYWVQWSVYCLTRIYNPDTSFGTEISLWLVECWRQDMCWRMYLIHSGIIENLRSLPDKTRMNRSYMINRLYSNLILFRLYSIARRQNKVSINFWNNYVTNFESLLYPFNNVITATAFVKSTLN